jgi:hypothetical protein
MAGIAVRVIAEQCARKTVRERLRREGVKLSYVSMREINAQAKLLLTKPEIIAEARAKAKALGYVADQGRPTHSHSKGTAEPQSVTEIRLPAAEERGLLDIADRGDGTMHEEEVCNFNFDSVLEPPHKWEDVVRHTNACEMLARQAALKQAGSDWLTYFDRHRVRLMNEASQLIARSRVLERWRLPGS